MAASHYPAQTQRWRTASMHITLRGIGFGALISRGDVVVADDLRVAHQASVTTRGGPRVLDRRTIAAGTAFANIPAATDRSASASA